MLGLASVGHAIQNRPHFQGIRARGPWWFLHKLRLVDIESPLKSNVQLSNLKSDEHISIITANPFYGSICSLLTMIPHLLCNR